jgi:hypothetical protein
VFEPTIAKARLVHGRRWQKTTAVRPRVKSLEELAAAYVEAILRFDDDGRVRWDSPHFKESFLECHRLRILLVRRKGGRQALVGLLEDARPAVRLHAAQDTCELAPHRTEGVLLEVARRGDSYAASAQLRITGWREGFGRLAGSPADNTRFDLQYRDRLFTSPEEEDMLAALVVAGSQVALATWPPNQELRDREGIARVPLLRLVGKGFVRVTMSDPADGEVLFDASGRGALSRLVLFEAAMPRRTRVEIEISDLGRDALVRLRGTGLEPLIAPEVLMTGLEPTLRVAGSV